ncbi:MAG: ABC transporter ATP-binding protein [Candidatus Lokiarchaeota archaeon]|nr:ABC transporter ATP-binding protein [Candidatus Lokiarchaeota archaeon]
MLGPSGCGKTTTLRAIAGLNDIDEGEIYFDDKPIQNIAIEKRNIGMVFQHFEIFPNMDVWDNISFSGKIKNWSQKKIENETLNALKLVNLIDKAGFFPEELSGPELQRVGIARAIASGSKILLLDEPLGALDQRYRDEFRIDLRKLIKKIGYTAIHVTHDQDEAMMISDKIAVMRKGQMLQVGTPNDLYTRPNSIFVANFIGESNFFVGYIEKKDDNESRITLRSSDQKIYSINTKFEELYRVVACIRKELVKILPIDKEDNYSIIGTVKKTAFLGSYLRIFLELDNGETLEAKVTYPPKFDIKEGNQVKIKMHPENVLLYEYPDNLEYELALE